MKRKIVAGLLCLTLAGSSFAVYAEEPAAAEETVEQEEETEEAASEEEEEAELEEEEAAEAETDAKAKASEEESEEDKADAEEEDTDRYNELTVGCTTPFSGSFFTKMWGTVVSDLDVQGLIHGYNLVEWRSDEGVFRVDPSVVSGITVTQNADGDRTYSLTIYDDLSYNDGTPITAADYGFAM